MEETALPEIKESTEAYQSLAKNLGKEFTDKCLIEVIGFDETLDHAIAGKNLKAPSALSPEIAGILSNKEDAITFARKKILKEKGIRFKKYFASHLNENSTIEDVKMLMENMIDDITHKLSTDTIENNFFDFMCLFTFDLEIRHSYPKIENTHGMITKRKKTITTLEFRNKFLHYLNTFYKKIDQSPKQDKMVLFFLNELLRRQSGDREGIGNAMNPMYQHQSLDDMFGDDDVSQINGLLSKIIFQGKRHLPGTPENLRKKMGDKLEKILKKYMFPKEYNLE